MITHLNATVCYNQDGGHLFRMLTEITTKVALFISTLSYYRKSDRPLSVIRLVRLTR